MESASSASVLKLLDAAMAAAAKAGADDQAEKDRCVDILKTLSKHEVTTKVLGETQAGKRVRTLTKHADAGIASAAADVVSCWKDLVRRESMSTTTTQSQQPSSQGEINLSRAASVAQEPATATEKKAADGTAAAAAASGGAPESLPASQQPIDLRGTQSQSLETAPSGGPAVPAAEVPQTSDPVRNKIRTNLIGALQLAVNEGAVGGNAVEVGVAIETALHLANGGVNQKYKEKFRQLHFNLKDDKNPDLRRKVLEGDIPPDVLIVLEPEALASDVKREENARIREKKLFDAAPSSVKLATTDQFQCGKCRQRKCVYYQMQTRSADEPMTTFVSCTNCPNKWKFS